MSRTRKRRQRGGSNEETRLENVLGITAAVGYNKEVLRQATSLSKNSRSNYLTQTLRNKKLEAFLKGVEPKRWLVYAVKKKDPYVVRRLLENPPSAFKAYAANPQELLKKAYGEKKQTLLDTVLKELSTSEESDPLIAIAILLTKYGVFAEKKRIKKLWELPPDELTQLLDGSPLLRERLLEIGRNKLEDLLFEYLYCEKQLATLLKVYNDMSKIQDDIRMSYNNNNLSIRFDKRLQKIDNDVEDVMTRMNDFKERKERLFVEIKFFHRFLDQYAPHFYMQENPDSIQYLSDLIRIVAKDYNDENA